jgi:hypothetical protein
MLLVVGNVLRTKSNWLFSPPKGPIGMCCRILASKIYLVLTSLGQSRWFFFPKGPFGMSTINGFFSFFLGQATNVACCQRVSCNMCIVVN